MQMTNPSPAMALQLSHTAPYRADFKGPIVAGWVVLAVALGGFGTWAVTAPLSNGVTAQGTMMVDSNRKSIQHLEGGIVKEILVRDGDAVAAGQPLVRLDETQLLATLKLTQGRLDDAMAQQARLSAERANRDAITFAPDLVQRARTEVEVAEILDGHRQLFQARRESLVGQVDVLNNRIEQSQSQIQGLERQVASTEQQMVLIKRELAGKQELAVKGYTAEVQVMAVERELARLDGMRGEHTAQIAQVQQAMNEARLQILNLQTKFREDAESQLREAEAQVFDLSERLGATKAQFQRLTVTAPVDGTVVDLTAHTHGGVVAPGQRILDVVPADDTLVVEAQVATSDIDDVHPGMPAEVHFSSFSRGTTPTLKGSVGTVSADRLVHEKTGVPFYRVRVNVDPDSLDGLNGLKLVPGMPAEVMVNKNSRTLFDYFLVPFQQLVARSLRK